MLEATPTGIALEMPEIAAMARAVAVAAPRIMNDDAGLNELMEALLTPEKFAGFSAAYEGTRR